MLYNVLLVSAIQQCESAVSIYVSPPSWRKPLSPLPSHPFRQSSQSIRLGSLFYAAIYTHTHTYKVVYICQWYNSLFKLLLKSSPETNFNQYKNYLNGNTYANTFSITIQDYICLLCTIYRTRQLIGLILFNPCNKQ